MKAGPPPLRFLVLVVGGWLCVRGVMLMPDRAEEAAAEPRRGVPVRERLVRQAGAERPPPTRVALTLIGAVRSKAVIASPVLHSVPTPDRLAGVTLGEASATRFLAPETPPIARPPLLDLPAAPPSEERWSGSAWAFVRRGGSKPLAAGGVLGGSQVGARLSYRLNREIDRPLQAVARAYAPIADMSAAEIAVGLEWKPVAGLPVRLLAERRQAVGSTGRSAFSLLAYGGVSERRLVGPVRLDAYAQAGVVGLRRRDLFADGSVRLTAPIDSRKRLRAGVGLWGAAQPGLSRLDVGPRLSIALPSRGAILRLAAEWRFRAAGNAAPASGPALTLSSDF